MWSQNTIFGFPLRDEMSCRGGTLTGAAGLVVESSDSMEKGWDCLELEGGHGLEGRRSVTKSSNGAGARTQTGESWSVRSASRSSNVWELESGDSGVVAGEGNGISGNISSGEGRSTSRSRQLSNM